MGSGIAGLGMQSAMASGWAIASFILAIVAAVLVLTLFLTKKNKTQLKGFLEWLYRFLNFDILVIEIVVKFLYIFTTVFIVLSSFNLISVNFIMFLSSLIGGVVVTRVVYEMVNMAIKICKNITEINEKLGKDKK